MTRNAEEPGLRRAIGLPLLVLYGLGVTIGAGIYVLVGTTAARAGIHAPAAFLLAAVVMGFSAGSFAEFSGRIPQAAGEAVFVDAGFRRNWLTLWTGLFVVMSAIVASAAIALGAAGYMELLVPLPHGVLVAGIILAMTAIAARGVRESLGFAAVMTLIEVAGLAVVVGAGLWQDPGMLARLPSALPPLGDGAAMTGVISASLIAFFAFLGFDDTINMVEEVHDPRRVVPLALFISLAAVTVIYVLVTFVAVQSLPPEELGASAAPIALLYERLTGVSPVVVTLIGIVATMNGIVIQIIMAARVLYGLARKGRLPAALGRVHPASRTPVIATLAVGGLVLALALTLPLEALAEWSSVVILAVFLLVNLALVRIKRRGDPAPDGIVTVPLIVPSLGALFCAALLAGAVVTF
ncbi:amino acid permease [Halovulum dunhuangense]|uniref:Amino acid permease n=1 Tax=Halovulum dunhuangense TaxID=1505036 RepID=A0A849KPL3_9RHOB|nr:APC family permease [Halovulum dunhuangense]NNU78993.1 amino acid permease [Halovulum dunhuangense]